MYQPPTLFYIKWLLAVKILETEIHLVYNSLFRTYPDYASKIFEDFVCHVIREKINLT